MDEELEDALQWFSDWIHQPHSLRQLCRIYIRAHLGSDLVGNIDTLPLPPALVDYVALKEVEDHHLIGYWERPPSP